MNSLTQNKTLMSVLILAVFILLAFVFYSYSSPSSSLTEIDSNSQQMGQTLLVTLAGLNTIRLDGSIFADPVFVSLTDYGVVLPSQPSGRRNPFLPIGSGDTVR